MKYIGMDAHASTCSFCVVNESGNILDSATVETNGRLLVDYVRGIEGTKQLTFEESEISHWLYGLLREEVEKLIVCNPVVNREYKRAKTDKLDARRLANMLRGQFLEGVYHDGSEREKFRSLMAGYQDLVEEAVRLKCRYKSLFRKEGKRKLGEVLYKDESFLKDFERADYRFIGERTFSVIQRMEEERAKYLEEIEKVSRHFSEIRNLKTIPGIGPIQAAKIVSQVIDPFRFESKYKFYSYCGLVRHKKMSAGKAYGSKKIRGNRVLKCVYKMAGHQVLKGKSELRKYYDRLRTQGMSHKHAQQSVCRKIAAISLSVWKHQKKYDEGYLKENPLN